MGANAEIKSTVIYRMRESARICDYQVVRNVQATTKLTNVMLLGDCWGWASPAVVSSQSRNALPLIKCDVNGFYFFVRDAYSGIFSNVQTGKYYLKLDQDKYADESTPANVPQASSIITSDEMYVLLNANDPANPLNFYATFGTRLQLLIHDVKDATHNGNTITGISNKSLMLMDFWI
jgi:hypothetical protein